MGKKREGLSVAREVRAGGGAVWLGCVSLPGLSLLYPRGVGRGRKIKSLRIRERSLCFITDVIISAFFLSCCG